MVVHSHPTAEISAAAEIGEGTYIWHHAQVREGAKVGRNCRLGKGVYVDKNVIVGDNCKIQNGATLYDGVTLEDEVFVGPHVVFTNDLYPRAHPDDWTIVPTLVKKGASLGANATILCGITIGSYAVVGAGAVVTRDVPDHALILGNPARQRGYVCHCGRPLDENLYCSYDEKEVRIAGE
jgi:acetyltransferase-like isoleucine patch superfamily enzyme